MGSMPTNPKHLDPTSRSSLSQLWHCHSYGISSSPQASPGSPALLPRPLPRQRCGDRGTPGHPHTPNQLRILCPTAQRCPRSYRLWSRLLLSRLSADRRERLSRPSALRAASPARAPPSGPRNRSGQPGSREERPEAGPATAAVRSCQKTSRDVVGEPQVWPQRGRSRRVASTSPPQRSAVRDYLRVTQPEPSRAPYRPLSGPPQPGPGSVPRPPHEPLTGAPHLGREAAAGAAQPRALRSAPATPSGPLGPSPRRTSPPRALTSPCPFPWI